MITGAWRAPGRTRRRPRQTRAR